MVQTRERQPTDIGDQGPGPGSYFSVPSWLPPTVPLLLASLAGWGSPRVPPGGVAVVRSVVGRCVGGLHRVGTGGRVVHLWRGCSFYRTSVRVGDWRMW